jgi:Mor family transcriptional regulator
MANVTNNTVEQEIKNGRSVAEIARKYRLTRQAIYWHIDKINKKEKFKIKPGRKKITIC